MPFPPPSVGLPTAHVATQASQDQHSQIQEVSFLFLGVLEFWYAFKHVQQQYIYLSIWLLSIHVTTNQASQPQLSRHNINTLKTQRQHSTNTNTLKRWYNTTPTYLMKLFHLDQVSLGWWCSILISTYHMSILKKHSTKIPISKTFGTA